MCIGYPVRVLDVTPGVLPMGHVAHGDAVVSCCLAYVPEAQVGDYVIVQNGFAIETLDETAAAESLAAFAELAAQGVVGSSVGG